MEAVLPQFQALSKYLPEATEKSKKKISDRSRSPGTAFELETVLISTTDVKLMDHKINNKTTV
jgi:hypothetical protein